MERINLLKKLLKSNRGLTLVELLAVIVLISLVFVLVNSMHLFGLKQYDVQSKDIDHQSQVRLAMNVLTKEIRKADSVVVRKAGTSQNTLVIDDRDLYTFNQQNHTIDKNGTSLIRNISQFTVNRSEQDKVTLTIMSVPDKMGNSFKLSTDLFIRGEGE